jgi:predicted PurR-regulated permease PerM
MAEPQRNDRILGLAALALLVAGCLLVLVPFVTALVWAVILTFSTWPIYVRLLRAVGSRNTIAAALMTLATSLVLLAPLVIVVIGLADNASMLMDGLRTFFEDGLPEPPSWVAKLPLVGSWLANYWQGMVHDETQLLAALGEQLAEARTWLVRGGGYLAAGVMQLGLSVLVAFFLFRDGKVAALRLQRGLARVAGPDARYLLEVAGNTVKSVVYGILGTAMAQGLLSGIGFFVAGVPGASLLGLATFFLSVVPIGPPIIWGGATIWLYHHGEIGWAIFMFLWGALVISLVDNFLKPLIISRGSHLPFILVFLGVIGGVIAFGFIGVFLGPTLLAVGYRVLSEWMKADVTAPQQDGHKRREPLG